MPEGNTSSFPKMALGVAAGFLVVLGTAKQAIIILVIAYQRIADSGIVDFGHSFGGHIVSILITMISAISGGYVSERIAKNPGLKAASSLAGSLMFIGLKTADSSNPFWFNFVTFIVLFGGVLIGGAFARRRNQNLLLKKKKAEADPNVRAAAMPPVVGPAKTLDVKAVIFGTLAHIGFYVAVSIAFIIWAFDYIALHGAQSSQMMKVSCLAYLNSDIGELSVFVLRSAAVMLGGYVTGRMARFQVYKNALCAGVICMAVDIACWNSQDPLWMALAPIVLAIPLTLWGAKIALRQKSGNDNDGIDEKMRRAAEAEGFAGDYNSR